MYFITNRGDENIFAMYFITNQEDKIKNNITKYNF